MPVKKYYIVLLLLLSGCDGGMDHGSWTSNEIPKTFSSNGERIYFTGISASGKPISARGGDGSMNNMHQQMHGGGCANCHGVEREGQRLMPRFWVKAPALTSAALFGDDDHQQDSSEHDGHGDHASYDAASLKRAIIDGVDPAGEALDQAMPRWSMDASDLDNLIAYLQTSPDH